MSKTNETVTIPIESVSKLLKYAKMYAYLMNSFTKTYMVVEETVIKLYFVGNGSVVSTAIDIVGGPVESVYLTIDINKLLLSLKRVSKGQDVELTFFHTPDKANIASSTSGDNISLGINYYEKNAQITSIIDFFDEKSSDFEKGYTLNISSDLRDFVGVTTSYMAATGKSNGIAIFNNKLSYSDRTVVISQNTLEPVDNLEDEEKILVHKFVLGFLDFVGDETSTFLVNPDKNAILWQSADDENFWAVIAIEPCSVGVPTKDELAAVSPGEDEWCEATIKLEEFVDAIEFFSGMFEASHSWKPITFFWNFNQGNEKITLNYQHPSTNVVKDLICESFSGPLSSTANMTSFILISDTVKTLLGKLKDGGLIRLRFNDKLPNEPHGQGVNLDYINSAGEVLYESLFIKLGE